jgi:hypothetical protein
MADHDAAIERHLAFHADAAKLREIALQTATARADLDGALTARQKLTDETDTLAIKWIARITAMAPALSDKAAELLPGMLEDWLRRRSETLDAQQQLQQCERQIEAAQQDHEASRERLSKALSALGETVTSEDGFDTLVDRAETLISREARLTGHFQAETAARRDLKRRQTELREAEEQAQGLGLAWKAVCAKSWLGERDQMPAPDEVREILALLTELGPALKQRASLGDRIAKMERDQADYENAVTALASEAGLDATGMSATHLAHRLAERYAAADAAHKQHQALTTRREETLEQQRAHAETMAAHRKLKAELLAALDAETCLMPRRRSASQANAAHFATGLKRSTGNSARPSTRPRSKRPLPRWRTPTARPLIRKNAISRRTSRRSTPMCRNSTPPARAPGKRLMPLAAMMPWRASSNAAAPRLRRLPRVLETTSDCRAAFSPWNRRSRFTANITARP